MIEFVDKTLIETFGFRDSVTEIMSRDGTNTWMLRSQVYVITPVISSTYVLHFWPDGKVVIKATDRPITDHAPDDDLRELSQWSTEHGWDMISVDNLLVEEPSGFQFWLRVYQSGLVNSGILKKYDEDEMKRLSEAYTRDEEEDF